MEGSNLSGVSGRCSWEEPNQQQLHNHYNMEDNRETHYDLNSRGKAQISDYGKISFAFNIEEYNMTCLVKNIDFGFFC